MRGGTGMDGRNRFRVTVGGIVEHEDRILIIKLRHLRDDDRIVYTTGGGHVERGETLLEALKREIREETGYLTEPAGLIGIYPQTYADHDSIRFSFVCTLVSEEAAAPEPSILGVSWMDRDQIEALRPHWRPGATTSTFEDYFAGKRYPMDIIRHITHP